MKRAIHRKCLNYLLINSILLNIPYPMRGHLLGYTELKETIATSNQSVITTTKNRCFEGINILNMNISNLKCKKSMRYLSLKLI